MIFEILPVGPFQCNCMILGCEQTHQAVVIDPGEASDNGFAEMTDVVKGLASTYCGGRIVSCLEGGYNLSALARSVGRHLKVLMESL